MGRYKNYKCEIHNKFFEVNVYQKDPINRHHWRATLARPARDIDLPPRAAPGQTNTPNATYTATSTGRETRESNAGLQADMDDDVPESPVRDVYDCWSDAPMKDLTACDKECSYCGNCSC